MKSFEVQGTDKYGRYQVTSYRATSIKDLLSTLYFQGWREAVVRRIEALAPCGEIYRDEAGTRRTRVIRAKKEEKNAG